MRAARLQKAEKAARKAAQKSLRKAAALKGASLQSSGLGRAHSRKPPTPTKSLSLELANFQDPEVRYARPLLRALDIKHSTFSQLSSHFPIKPEVTHILKLVYSNKGAQLRFLRICARACGTSNSMPCWLSLLSFAFYCFRSLCSLSIYPY